MAPKWHEAKQSFMELPRLHVQWIEREIASISSETEKHALQKARVELLQAIYTVLSISEQQPPAC